MFVRHLGYNVYMTNELTENKAEGKNFPVRSNNKNARKPAKNGAQGKRTTDRQQTKPDKRAPGFDRSAKSKSDKRLAVGRAPETAYPLAYAPDETRGARQKKPDKNEKVKIIFLGGVGEIGKNLTAFEYADEIVVIDAGLTFPTDEMPGIDTVIPDITYLKENREKVKAVFLTHGHEDHIGAVPYLLRQIDAPVYGSKLTLGLLSNKLTERRVEGDLREIRDGQTVRTKYFSAEFIHVCHSVAGSMAIALRTPVGTIFHTGDFKIDYTPIGGESMNLNRFAEIGNEGVLLLLAESTNVERPGYTMSEVVVTSTLRKLFVENADRRIIIATFASNVDRVQQILELASEFKRKVALGDRSLHNNQNIYNSVEKLKNDFEEKLRTADVYENLKKTANGEIVSDNSKITFERYIMGSYFEQVLYYANLRFSKMTGGRYEIVRGESRDKRISAGLEISVRDNFNNKERDISSLSGGESFQASLALALGLSDIIQQRNGGIRLDSIFIDEGFGSLDNDSLASAIETLNDLTGNGNRLVGIISHISELKNSIGNKIEVVGTKSGSSIKIITD